MSASLRLDGVAEMTAALRRLPQEFQQEARQIVLSTALMVEHEIDAAYARHEQSGHLRRGLVLDQAAAGPFGVAAVVRSRAKHAGFFEHGTARRTYTGTDRRGRRFTNANRGRIAEHRFFVPSAVRHRRVMDQRLVSLVRRAGFTVTGIP